MTGILTCVVIILAARIVYLEFQRHDQEEALSKYRILVLEWYHYLHDKENNEDFELWRKELDEEV